MGTGNSLTSFMGESHLTFKSSKFHISIISTSICLRWLEKNIPQMVVYWWFTMVESAKKSPTKQAKVYDFHVGLRHLNPLFPSNMFSFPTPKIPTRNPRWDWDDLFGMAKSWKRGGPELKGCFQWPTQRLGNEKVTLRRKITWSGKNSNTRTRPKNTTDVHSNIFESSGPPFFGGI